MIKDMIAKLEADAAAEGDQKAWCDSEMEKATSKRDENIGSMEGDLAAKTKAESTIAKLKEEIQTLLNEISELNKALAEATELRRKEQAENTKTLADANAGLAGVKKAMKILKDFYDNAFVQTNAAYKPPMVTLQATLSVTLPLTVSQVILVETRAPPLASSDNWMLSNRTLKAQLMPQSL